MNKIKLMICTLGVIFILSGCGFNYIKATKEAGVPFEITLIKSEIKTIEDLSAEFVKFFLPEEEYETIKKKSKWSTRGDLGKKEKIIEVRYKGVMIEIKVLKKDEYVDIDIFDIKAHYKNYSATATTLFLNGLINIFVE